MTDGKFSVFCPVHIYIVFVTAYYITDSSATNIQDSHRNLQYKPKEIFLRACATSRSQMQLLRHEEVNTSKR
jgi:hypothetical protein